MCDSFLIRYKYFNVFFFILFINFSYGQLSNFALQVTVTNETCSGNGLLSFNVTGQTAGSTIVYSIYHLPDVTTPIAITGANSITGLVAGNYRVVATQSLGALSNSQQQDATVLDRIVPLQYNLTTQNALCGNDGKLIVTITQGTAVNYEIIGGPVLFPLQTSNVFTGLTVGTYQVRIFDSCGNGIVSDFTIQASNPNVTIGDVSFEALSCTTANINVEIVSGTINQGNAIAYPLQVVYTVYPPSGAPIIVNQTIASGDLQSEQLVFQVPVFYDQSFTYNVTITDACGNVYQTNNTNVILQFDFGISETMEGCLKKMVITPVNFVPPFSVNFISAPAGFTPSVFNGNHPGPFTSNAEYFNATIPYPEGSYVIQITDACGRSITKNYVTHEIPLSVTVSETALGCVKIMSLHVNVDVPFTVVFLSAPAGFNPLLYNPLHPGPFTNSTEYYNATIPYPEGTYVIQVTDDCGRTVTKTYTTTQVSLPAVSYFVLPGCGAGQGSVLIQMASGGFQTVSIVSAPAALGQTLPYDVSTNIKSDPKYFSMNSLPVGTYVLAVTDVCNRTRTITVNISGYQITSNVVSVTEHCSSFDVSLNYTSNTFSNSLWLQRYDALTNTWGHPQTGFSNGSTINSSNAMVLSNHANNVNLNFFGRFRIVNTFSVFGNKDNPNVECQNIIHEFEFVTGPKINNVYSYSCSNNLFDVIVEATGVAPLQYRITTKNGLPFFVNNATSPSFTSLGQGVYNFQVEDACGNILNRVYDISSPVSFSISSDNLCDGQTGSLFVPNFSFLSYEWWKDNNTSVILSATNSLQFPNFNSTANFGIYHVRIRNSSSPNSCMDIVLDFTISDELYNPHAGTGSQVVFCGNQGVFNLFSFLSGTYNNNGVWQEISSSGMLTNHTWDATNVLPGVYDFKYRVNGSCNLFEESFVRITINEIPQSPVASGDLVVCEGQSLHLFASNIPSVAIYQWSGPNGFVSSIQNPVLNNVSVLNQGTYTVSVLQNGCASPDDSVVVAVEGLPDFTIKNSCQNELTYLSAEILNSSIDLNSLEYNWTSPDGTTFDTNPINVTGNTTGLYSLTVSNGNGCSVNKTIRVSCTYCGIPKGVSPNGDGLNDNFDLSCLSGITNVKIFNRYGMNVFEKDGYVDDWTGKDYKGNLLPAATYYYVVRFETGDVKTGWVYLNY